MISQGECQIIDAKVQFVGQKRMARYAYILDLNGGTKLCGVLLDGA